MNLDALLHRISSPKVRTWVLRLAKFFLGQGAVQGINLITGFLLVRWLSVEDYALFGVVFGFQITLAMFVDLGFSGSIVALVGARGDDRAVLGRYIATARSLRLWSMLIALPIAAAAFGWIGLKQSWPLWVQAVLFSAVVAGIFCDGIVTYNGAALLIHQRIGTYYRAPVEAAGGRLLLCLLMKLVGWLWAVPLCFVNVLSSAWTGWRYRQGALLHFEHDAKPDPAVRREMLGYLGPVFPGLIFTAFQGQILIFLSSIFAGTQQIAEMTALGRLNQLFVLMTAVNGTLISPYFAKLPSVLVLRRGLQVLAGAGLLSAALAGLAFLFPGPLVWLLGPTYAHLEPDMGWSILGAVTSFFGTVMWAINSSRKWIYWWSSVVYIVVVTIGQAGFLTLWGADSTRTLLYLSVFTNLLVIGVHAQAALVGLGLERRERAASGA